MMRKIKKVEEEDLGKFSIGETVYLKHNTALKLKIVRRLGVRYFCITSKKIQTEIMYLEDDLISKWQIPFFSVK